MNIKKIITLGLILILSFPMLYLPLSDISSSNSENTSSDNQPNVEPASPIITLPILKAFSDDYFEATFTVMNNWPAGGQHTFRVYAYLDYVRSNTKEDEGNHFHDGANVKKKGPFEYSPNNDPKPYDDIPYRNSMDPYEGFMGSERKRIFARDAQLKKATPYTFTASCDNPLAPNHNPGEIYFVVQMLWRADQLILSLLPPYKYWARYRWKTYIYSFDLLLNEMKIYDDDTNAPVIPTESDVNPWFEPINLPPYIFDNIPTFPLEVCAYDLGTSGPHPYNAITFGSVNVYNGEYLSGQDELIELDPYGNDIYAYWYRYNIPNNFVPGSHTVELKVWDKDYDGWAGDRLSASHEVIFTVIDDDTNKPGVQFFNDWVIKDCDAHLESIDMLPIIRLEF
ncbi:hypothetical protein ES705_24934 [subsurface metagenome]